MNDTQARGEFVRLWTLESRRVFAFILSVLPRVADAEDVLQETGVLAWERFSEFTVGTDFRAWATQIAHFKVLEYRRSLATDRLVFSGELLDRIEATYQQEAPQGDRRQTALARCLKKLATRDRGLLRSRYAPGATAKSIAAAEGRSVDAIYKALNRIHDALFECIQRALAREGKS